MIFLYKKNKNLDKVRNKKLEINYFQVKNKLLILSIFVSWALQHKRKENKAPTQKTGKFLCKLKTNKTLPLPRITPTTPCRCARAFRTPWKSHSLSKLSKFSIHELKKSRFSYLTFQSSTSLGAMKTWKSTQFREYLIKQHKNSSANIQTEHEYTWFHCAIKNNVLCDYNLCKRNNKIDAYLKLKYIDWKEECERVSGSTSRRQQKEPVKDEEWRARKFTTTSSVRTINSHKSSTMRNCYDKRRKVSPEA